MSLKNAVLVSILTMAVFLSNTAAVSAFSQEPQPTIRVISVSKNQVRFAYKNFPPRTYVDLLWKNAQGNFESDGQVTIQKHGRGYASIKLDGVTPHGIHKLQGRSIGDMTWSVDSSEFAIGDTSSSELNCVLTATPATVKRSGTVTFSWESLGANYLVWKRNSAAENLRLSTEEHVNGGSETVKVPARAKKGRATVVLEMYREDGTRGMCSKEIRIR